VVMVVRERDERRMPPHRPERRRRR
jgi:hypothetical protein